MTYLDREELWEDVLEDDLNEFLNDGGTRGMFYEEYRDRLKEGLETVASYRREIGGHKVHLEVSVVQPMCIDCAYGWRLFYPELLDKVYEAVPDISADDWTSDLAILGLPGTVICQMEEQVLEGIDEDVRGPFCYDCKRPLPYWEDEDSACYCVKTPFSEYIGHHIEEDAVSVSKSLKKAIVEVYGPICFGCDKALKQSEVTIDHVVPKAQGGKADMFNLQPLCESCNQEKADTSPLEMHIVLHFPLRPIPSDSYEGWIW